MLIVAGHSYRFAGINPDTTFERLITSLISGGTSLFVFISGFLFHYIFYKKYIFKKFFIGKIKNVFIPYLILALIPTLYAVLLHKDGAGGYFLPDGTGFTYEYIIPFIKYYLNGGMLTAYWYIPFVMVTFAMSSLHVKFIELDKKYQLLLIFILSLVSIFLHRPYANLHVLQSVIYFIPVYLIGIYASVHRSKIYEVFKGKGFVLLIFTLAIAFIDAYTNDKNAYFGIDLVYIQKVFMCFFFMVWLNKYEEYHNSFIHKLASTSFTIFFIHPYILLVLGGLQGRGYIITDESWWLFPIIIALIILFSMLVAITIRKLMPKYSRYLIGY